MTKEEQKAYALKVGVSQSKVDEVMGCVLDSWDDTKVRKYLKLVGDSHKAQQLNPTTDYTDATLKCRMAQEMSGKSDDQLKKEADDIASVIVNGHV